MASTITVDNIIGKTATDNVHIPGHVVQVVHGKQTGQQSTNSTTLIETGLSVSITPKKEENIFLILASLHECVVEGPQGAIGLVLARNGVALSNTNDATLGYTNSAGSNYFNVNLHDVDSPSTTNSITYSVLVQSKYEGRNVYWSGDGTPIFMTVMEIAQ